MSTAVGFTGPAEDRLAIRERYGAYSDSAFRADVEAWLECFTEDAVRVQGGTETRGHAALRQSWDAIWTVLERMGFFAEIAAIEVDGETARGRCWCREILFLKGGGLRKVVGMYDDRLVRDGGVWRFSRREYRLYMDEGTTERGASAKSGAAS